MYIKFINTMENYLSSLNKPVTRGDFIEIVVYAMGLNREHRRSVFLDITDSSTISNSVGVAYEYQLINGYPDKTFKPEEILSDIEKQIIVNRVYNYYYYSLRRFINEKSID